MRAAVAMMMAASWPAMAVAQQAPAPVAPTTAPVAAAPVVTPSVAVAQQVKQTPAAPAAQDAEEGGEEGDIVVQGRRPPGSVVGDIPAEQVLGPADVRSYGVSSVSDLLTELAPQTRSGAGGAPVVLLDGKRIAGFQEIRDIPTEAILRVDILPEEVALKYGYTADQKVVNFVLRRRFRATTVELADRAATEGGRNTPQGDLDLLTIRNGSRLNIHSKYQQSSALTESERDIALATTEGGATGFDQRPYRTLPQQPFSRSFGTNVIYARPLGDVSTTINGELTATQSVGRFGLPLDAANVPLSLDPLTQRSNGVTGHLGTSLNGRLSPRWLWTVTGNYDRADTRTIGDTVAGRGSNRGHSVSDTGELEALANGPLFALPAGDVTTAIRVGASTSDFSSESLRGGLVTRGDVSRDSASGRANIDLPIASRSRGVLPFLGQLSVNGNFALNQLSDFGTLTAYGYGLNWGPVDGVRVIGSINQQDVAPTAAQLGNPTLVTPNVRVFDYVQGQTVTVTTVSGGNPALRSSDRRVTRLGLNLKPWSARDLTLQVNYTKQDTRNPIQGFPSPTAAIEAAFPTRFTRDAAGNLTRLDTRSINFARRESEEIRWGINFSRPIKSKIQKQIEAFRAGTGPNPFAGLRFPGANGRPGGERRPAGEGRPGGERPAGDGAPPPPADGAAPPPPGGGDGGGRGFGGPGGGPGGGRGFGGGGFGGGGGRGGAGGGRIQFALYHTWHLTERVTVADGGPLLDLLRGDAIGATGGQPRHEFEAQAGYSNNGIGVRLSGEYATGTRVNGGTAANPQTLRFSGLATANLRLFGDLGQQLGLLKAHPWVRGMRVTFSIDNLFNGRQRVTDGAGVTPISYQPDYNDPLGRTVRLSVRKLFF
ncbi:TonB-dependent receptor [Sphingomonas sp. RP10(2022)]|uniref:TonB-dependent receptor n=1 Tax=Sphingomonas liriopis TaxID=2949094 RepID=A0A9X2KR22_9SPHN|nr:TonB-dependent receptor [Sphingomonas liriopis]MCP3735597.1 TonB-dependent receptor [Sphingomonas liriopis]